MKKKNVRDYFEFQCTQDNLVECGQGYTPKPRFTKIGTDKIVVSFSKHRMEAYFCHDIRDNYHDYFGKLLR